MHKNNILIQSCCEASTSIKHGRRGRQLLIETNQTNTDEPQSNVSLTSCGTFPHYTNIKTSVQVQQFCVALGRWSLTFPECPALTAYRSLNDPLPHQHTERCVCVCVCDVSHRTIHVLLSLSANTWREEPATSRKKTVTLKLTKHALYNQVTITVCFIINSLKVQLDLFIKDISTE